MPPVRMLVVDYCLGLHNIIIYDVFNVYKWMPKSFTFISYQSFFPKFISAWNGLAQEIAVAKTLDLFKILSLNQHIRLYADLSAILFVKESC